MAVVLHGDQITDYADDNGNRIIGTPDAPATASIEFRSNDCTITFASGSRFQAQVFFLRERSQITIGPGSLLRGRAMLGADSAIVLGVDVYSGFNVQITTAEGCTVHIGNDVMIANDCRIRADDSHPIYDGVTGARINHSASITIGEHVWIGQEVFLMPGASVASGSVVGARSMVTRSHPVPANVLAIGTPARVHRRNIHWLRKHLQMDSDVPATIDPVFAAPELSPGRGSQTPFLSRVRRLLRLPARR